MMRRGERSGAWLLVGIIALIAFGVFWALAMVWWLVWSILDLANGNPATWWNVLGIVLPALSLLGSISGKKS